MKKTTLFLFMFINCVVHAQFSNDPVNPLEVCNAANNQSNVVALNDNGKGYYVFWRDSRNDPNQYEIFGQHLDSSGHALWTSNGKRIVESNGNSVSSFRCIRMQNGTLVTWIQNQDSMFCKLINNNGNDVWAQPTLVATNGNGILYVDVSGFNVFLNDSGATITHSYVYTGGSSLFSYNRVSFAGDLRWPVNNFLLNMPGYDFRSVGDGKNGFYTLSKGNGIGSAMHIQHYDLQGVAKWPNHIDITGGGGSNGIGGNISLVCDADTNMYCVWDNSVGQVMISKLSAQGNYPWSPVRRAVSSIAQTQSRSHAMIRSNNIYVIWNDSRIANQTSVYIQKVDTSGSDAWTVDGVYVGIANGYYAYPRVTYSDSNSVACFYLGTGSINLEAQRIRSDSTLSWGGNGVVLSSGGNWISYADYSALSDAQGCNAVFWTTFNNNIRGAKVCSDGILVNIEENQSNEFNIYPVPGLQNITIEFSGEKFPESIYIFSLEGKLITIVTPSQGRKVDIDVSHLEPGMYIAKCKFHNGNVSRKFLVSGY